MLVLGIVVASVVLAVLCLLPPMRRRWQVRRFRQHLVRIESVALSWGSSLGPPLSDAVPEPVPAVRRVRRGRRRRPDGQTE